MVQIQKLTVTLFKLFIVSRFFLLFIPVILQDAPTMTFEEGYWTNPKNSVPVIYFIQLLLFHRIFGYNVVGVRLGMIIIDMLCILFLYKLCIEYQIKALKQNPEKARENSLIIIVVYTFFPTTLFIYSGHPENLASLFLILGIYYYLKDNYILSGIFLSIGFQTEFYPIFCLIPIFAKMLSQRAYKKILKMVASFIIPFVIIELQFFLIDPVNFLKSYLVQFSRSPTSLSLWENIYQNTTIWNLISLGNLISLSPVGITFLVFFIPYILIVVIYFKKHKESSVREVFAFISIFYLLFPVIFLSIFTRYLYFAFPFICLEIYSGDKLRKNIDRGRKITYFIIPISITTLVLWPNLLFTTLTQPITYIIYPSIYLLLFVSFYFIISSYWIKIGKRYSYNKDLKEKPSILALFSLNIIMMNLQIFLQEVSIAFLIIFYIIGLIPVFWIILRIKNSFLKPILNHL